MEWHHSVLWWISFHLMLQFLLIGLGGRDIRGRMHPFHWIWVILNTLQFWLWSHQAIGSVSWAPEGCDYLWRTGAGQHAWGHCSQITSLLVQCLAPPSGFSFEHRRDHRMEWFALDYYNHLEAPLAEQSSKRQPAKNREKKGYGKSPRVIRFMKLRLDGTALCGKVKRKVNKAMFQWGKSIFRYLSAFSLISI